MGAGHHAVDHDLVARLDLEQVVGDDTAEADLRDLVVAPHPGSRGGQDGEGVEGPSGLELLGDADHAVGHDDAGEERVGRVAGHEDHDEQRADDRVDRGEHVGPDDVGEAADGRVGDVVDAAVGDALVDFGCGQAGRGGRHSAIPESS